MEAKFEEWRRKAGAGSGSLSMADSNCLAQIAAATANGGTLKRNKDKVLLYKNSLILVVSSKKIHSDVSESFCSQHVNSSLSIETLI